MPLKECQQESCIHAQALQRVTSRYERVVQTLSLLCEMDHIAGRAESIDILSHEILRTLATGLAAQNCSLHLINPDKQILEMQSAWSPADEVAPGASSPLLRTFRIGQGIMGKVARDGNPMRIDDAPTHPDFLPLPDCHVEVRSLICFPMRAEGRIAGVLNLSHSKPGFFTDEDEHTMALLADRASTILLHHFLRRRIQESEKHYRQLADRLEHSLHEKSVLLREVHHRVKNNLQLVSSMLDLQAGASTDPAATRILLNSRRRVRAMGLAHEKLYLRDQVEEVDFGPYVSSLVDYLRSVYDAARTSIEFQVDAKHVSVGLDVAVPCGLILNELIANAISHAFPASREGRVHVAVEHLPNEELTITVADNGIGLPEHIDPQHPATLGLQVVQMLTHQVGGRLEVQRTDGTRFTIRIASPAPQEKHP